MTDAVKLLSLVIDFADVVMRGQAIADRRDRLAAVHAEVAVARKTPVVDEPRFVGDHTEVLVQALIDLERARATGNARDALLWSQLAGLILPRVREDLGAALEQQARARG